MAKRKTPLVIPPLQPLAPIPLPVVPEGAGSQPRTVEEILETLPLTTFEKKRHICLMKFDEHTFRRVCDIFSIDLEYILEDGININRKEFPRFYDIMVGSVNKTEWDIVSEEDYQLLKKAVDSNLDGFEDVVLLERFEVDEKLSSPCFTASMRSAARRAIVEKQRKDQLDAAKKLRKEEEETLRREQMIQANSIRQIAEENAREQARLASAVKRAEIEEAARINKELDKVQAATFKLIAKNTEARRELYLKLKEEFAPKRVVKEKVLTGKKPVTKKPIEAPKPVTVKKKLTPEQAAWPFKPPTLPSPKASKSIRRK